VRGNHVVGFLGKLFEKPRVQIGTQPVLRDPLGDHTGGPARLLGQLEDPARPREQITDAVNDAAREQFGERFAVGGDIQRRVIEKIVVAKNRR